MNGAIRMSTIRSHRYRSVKEYASPYEEPRVFAKGETVRWERRESNWSGWLWCTSSSGTEAWVPEAWLEIRGDSGSLLHDYTAKELSVRSGDVLVALLEESGWIWARKTTGEEGWVPLDHLEQVSEP